MISRYKDKDKLVTYFRTFWKTSLSSERIAEIQAFLESLTADQIELVNDIVQDAKDDAEWEKDYMNSQ